MTVGRAVRDAGRMVPGRLEAAVIKGRRNERRGPAESGADQLGAQGKGEAQGAGRQALAGK